MVSTFVLPRFRYSREILEERKKSKRRRKKGRKSRASAPPELIDLADSEISSEEEEDGEDSGGEKGVHQGCDSRRKAGFKVDFFPSSTYKFMPPPLIRWLTMYMGRLKGGLQVW